MADPYQVLESAIFAGDVEAGITEAQRLAEAGVSPTKIFSNCIEPTLSVVGDKFSRLEIFLPEMVNAAEVVKAVQETLTPFMAADDPQLKKGRVVIGTVSGDLHDIGKNIVKAMLEVNGFEVLDLGVDVNPAVAVKSAVDFEADIVAFSALMLPSLPYVKDAIAMIKENDKYRERFKIIVGGGPVSEEWAVEAGADAYGDDAVEAVQVALALVGARGQELIMKHTTRMMDIVNRSLTGPIVDEETFNNQHVTQGINRVVKKYDIKVDRSRIVNFDDELADRIWQAAVDFLSKCGVFCQTTSRVIQHSEEEIETILQSAPSQIQLGTGTDACLEVARQVEDPRPPLNMGSPIGSPIPEALFIPNMVSYIQEPLVDVTCAASIETVHGYEIRTRSPLEIMAAWEEVDLMRSALHRAGRPGMAWTGVIMSMSDIGQLSAVNADGLRATDMCTFGVISELKTNFEIFNKLTHCIRQGGIIDPYANPIYGGLGGGIEGQAVLITAAMIALNVVFMAAMVGSSPTHPFLFNDTSKELMQATSVAFQALARNSHLMTNLTVTPVGGPGTKTLLYECVAYTVMSTVSGISRILGPRSATGSISAHFSGLEARFNGEVLHAAAQLNRENAEEIVQRAYTAYEDQLDQKPYGKPFQEVYDIQTVQPTKEWLDIYDEVKAEVIGWGLPMDQIGPR